MAKNNTSAKNSLKQNKVRFLNTPYILHRLPILLFVNLKIREKDFVLITKS